MKLIFIFLICTTFILKGQDIDSVYFYWNAKNKLKWTDFRGPIDTLKKMDDANAALSLLTRRSISKSNIVLNYDVHAAFYPLKAWFKSADDYGLLHEQKHFDLCEVYARLLRKDLLNAFNLEPLKDEKFENLVVKYEKLMWQEQELYDNETNHSINYSEQLRWNKKIEQRLKDLEGY